MILLHHQNKQYIFERKTDTERILVAINCDDADFVAHFDAGCGCGTDLITGEHYDFGGGSKMLPYSVKYIKAQ